MEDQKPHFCPLMSRVIHDPAVLVPGEGLNPSSDELFKVPCLGSECPFWGCYRHGRHPKYECTPGWVGMNEKPCDPNGRCPGGFCRFGTAIPAPIESYKRVGLSAEFQVVLAIITVISIGGIVFYSLGYFFGVI